MNISTLNKLYNYIINYHLIKELNKHAKSNGIAGTVEWVSGVRRIDDNSVFISEYITNGWSYNINSRYYTESYFLELTDGPNPVYEYTLNNGTEIGYVGASNSVVEFVNRYY